MSHREGVRVEVLLRVAHDNTPMEGRVQRGAHRVSRVFVIGRVEAKLRRKRVAALLRKDAGEIPSADEDVHPLANCGLLNGSPAGWQIVPGARFAGQPGAGQRIGSARFRSALRVS